jgi:hypothetical protein
MIWIDHAALIMKTLMIGHTTADGAQQHASMKGWGCVYGHGRSQVSASMDPGDRANNFSITSTQTRSPARLESLWSCLAHPSALTANNVSSTLYLLRVRSGSMLRRAPWPPLPLSLGGQV